MSLPLRFAATTVTLGSAFGYSKDSTGEIVYIEGGSFMMIGDNKQASPDEYPKHPVQVFYFWIDITEVTDDDIKNCPDGSA